MNANTPRILAALLAAGLVHAQVPDSPAPVAPAAPASAPIGQSAPVGQSAPPATGAKPAASPFGQEVPVLDPGSEVMTFNGKNWNIANNRIFQARFEKYLNAPEATSKEDVDYRNYIDRILTLLQPGNATPQNVDAAFNLLPYAARYDIDARLCASLADAVYSVWQAQRNQSRLTMANQALEAERKRHEWNLQMAAAGKELERQPQSNGGGRQGQGGAQRPPTNSTGLTDSDVKIASLTKRVVEGEAVMKANQVKRELSELQVKVEFQGLMVQYFLQRRFQHVLMSTRFYRALFTDGDTKLNLGKDAMDLFAKSTGTPPTVSILDSMANEAIRDVREGTKAFSFLLEKGEIYSATNRLQESFVLGEYMPEVRLIPREQKRKCLSFSQKGFQLISAIDVRDYERAEKLVKEMKEMASDFDDSKPTARIEGAKIEAGGKLALAKKAALNNDQAALEKNLTEAAMIWPGNPEYKEVFSQLNKQGDLMQKTLLEFDQLVSQRNHRQIWNDKIRFIAAVAINPERKVTLEKIMGDMEAIERSVLTAEEMARQGNHAGAWENLEKTFAKYPDDGTLNQRRADMTTRASDFVKTIRTAEELEKKNQFGSSLSHYLKAQKLYPASDFAREGVERLIVQVLPES
ncbi:MAG: hypothetical protein RL088_733 [Verrucomicrobiota bacterium]|jgi:hypothetical protein